MKRSWLLYTQGVYFKTDSFRGVGSRSLSITAMLSQTPQQLADATRIHDEYIAHLKSLQIVNPPVSAPQKQKKLNDYTCTRCRWIGKMRWFEKGQPVICHHCGAKNTIKRANRFKSQKNNANVHLVKQLEKQALFVCKREKDVQRARAESRALSTGSINKTGLSKELDPRGCWKHLIAAGLSPPDTSTAPPWKE